MNTDRMKGKIGFLILNGLCLSISLTCSAAQRPNDSPLFELPLPSKEFPSPHSSFWVTPGKLGFVTERVIKRKPEGALFIYDLRTKEIQKLLDRFVFFPAFLRTEKRISFVDVGKHQSITLFTMSLSGEDIREYDFEGAAVFHPSWSPDHRKVVFANLSYNADLLAADVQTREIEGLGDLGRDRETNGTEAPDWSPDGTEIVYVGWDKSSLTELGDYNPTISRIYKFDLRTHTYHRLTSGSFQDRYPAYSPDGKYIAFVSNRSKNFELWIMNRDGTGLRKLTDMVGRGSQVAWEKPAWSPDQSKIAFSATPLTQSRRDGLPFEGSKIWILDLGQPRRP